MYGTQSVTRRAAAPAGGAAEVAGGQRRLGLALLVIATAQLMVVLDISPHPCDYYLVLTGPPGQARIRPWVIDSVFLFEHEQLLAELGARGVKIGEATSVRKAEWEAARIFPAQQASPLQLSKFQFAWLALFSTTPATVAGPTAVPIVGSDGEARMALPDDLIQRGRSQGHLSLAELRTAFDRSRFTPSEVRSILRDLSESGVRLID